MIGQATAPRSGNEVAAPRRSWFGRASATLSAVIGAVSGAAPHVLHHAGPLAGTAIVGGAAGTMLFGALGFVLAIPMLWQLRRRFRTWTAPALALGIFVAVFTVSTVWVGPAIRGDGGGEIAPGLPTDHASHHE